MVHVLDDLAERAQRGHLGGLDGRQAGDALLHRRQDLDALDGVDAEAGLQLHIESEDVDGVTGLLGDDLEQQIWCRSSVGARGGDTAATVSGTDTGVGATP